MSAQGCAQLTVFSCNIVQGGKDLRRLQPELFAALLYTEVQVSTGIGGAVNWYTSNHVTSLLDFRIRHPFWVFRNLQYKKSLKGFPLEVCVCDVSRLKSKT